MENQQVDVVPPFFVIVFFQGSVDHRFHPGKRLGVRFRIGIFLTQIAITKLGILQN